MKIGIDLRHVALGAADEPSRWLRDTLTALFARDASHTYVLFHTVFNYHLFPTVGPNVTRRTLSAPRFFDELQDLLSYEGDFDLLLARTPTAALDRFPLEKQIACVPTFPLEAANNTEESRARLRAVRDVPDKCRALAAPSASVRDALRADPWTTTDVFVAPADDPEAAADALLAAFERAARAARSRDDAAGRVDRHAVIQSGRVHSADDRQRTSAGLPAHRLPRDRRRFDRRHGGGAQELRRPRRVGEREGPRAGATRSTREWRRRAAKSART